MAAEDWFQPANPGMLNMPEVYETSINTAKEKAKKTKAFNDTFDKMIQEKEEELGRKLTFEEKNALSDKAKTESELNLQSATDEAQKIRTMTPEEYQNSDINAVDVVAILRKSGMTDENIEKELRRLGRGELSDNARKALGMELVPDMDVLAGQLNEAADVNNPNLDALEEKRKDIHEKSVKNKKELEPELQKYMEQAESLIDPNYISNIPRSLWRDWARGDFGRRRIDSELKEDYDKIKDKAPSELTDEEKATIKEYKEQKAEKTDANWRFGTMILDALSSGLINIGSYIGGGGPVSTSKYEQIAQSKLGGGLARYNKKYADMANADTALLNSVYQNDREIDQQLKKVYADKAVQPYLTKLDLDTRRIFVNYVAAMGKNLKMEDIPGLMAGLWAYQDTGNLNQSTMNILSEAGSGFMGLLKTLIPGV